MVLQNKIYLTNNMVNGGVSLIMNAKSLNTSWAIMTNTINKPRQSVGVSYTDNLAPAVNTGLANPNHVLSGVVNLSKLHGDNVIDPEFIRDLLLNCDQIMVLRCDKFKTTTNINGDVNVMIKSYSDNLVHTNVLEFTMDFVEVKV